MQGMDFTSGTEKRDVQSKLHHEHRYAIHHEADGERQREVEEADERRP